MVITGAEFTITDHYEVASGTVSYCHGVVRWKEHDLLFVADAHPSLHITAVATHELSFNWCYHTGFNERSHLRNIPQTAYVIVQYNCQKLTGIERTLRKQRQPSFCRQWNIGDTDINKCIAS